MKIIGVNGIYSDGTGSTDLLLDDLHLQGARVLDLVLPVRGVLTSYFDSINRKDAQALVEAHEPGDAVLAHSRGALVVYWAMTLGARFSYVLLLSPAIESNWVWPCHQVNRIDVVYDPEDKAIALGMMLRFHHPFGALGRKGYEGPPDPRIHCYEIEGEGLVRHGSAFDDEYRSRWVRHIVRQAPYAIRGL